MSIRIIPRLDIKSSNLVKGIHLEGLRVLGKPEEFAQYYYENGADELLYMDIVASLYQRNSLLDIIKKTSAEIFIPLIVGGGLRTIDDIKTVLRSGADKVALNTAAIRRPEFVREASRRFGSSTILVSIEAKKMTDGSYEAYTDNGRERTGVKAVAWATRAVELGAGEIMVTSIDREGTGNGFDLELSEHIAKSVPVPVISCGGAGRVEHILDVFRQGKADAVSCASILHYHFLERFSSGTNAQESNKSVHPLGRRKVSSNIQPVPLQKIKKYLMENGIDCRVIP